MLAGVTIGWALISRPWTAVAIALPLALIALNDLFNHPRRFFRLYAVMFVAFLLVASIWPLYNWLATGSPTTNTYTLWWPYDRVGFGPGYGRLSGHTWEQAIRNFNVDFPDLGVTLLGWPSIAGVPLAWLAVLLGLFWPEHNRRDWALLIPPALLIAAYLAYWARGSSLYGPRYYAEGLPYLWIIAARGLLKVARKTVAAPRGAIGAADLAGIQHRLHDRAAAAGRVRSLRARASASRSDRGGPLG